MRISDWSSDVCSSDLPALVLVARDPRGEEMVLQHRDPAAGHGLVHRTVVDEVVELALLEFLRRGEPGRAMEAVGLGLGEAGLEIERASCRERGCQYVSLARVGGATQKKRYSQSSYDNETHNK